ncbi:hypothetical protein JQ574_28910 [Bradyrhizobium sp. AUGA SZCCT0158]|uniref:hypothetical protein n=1 Tax=Bradyrhizobium sp. AUGA SZCCT0158 TaxID=2807661 RepID=UPI001BA494E8|nr:hypothetical protein [Bradyrhizobium sp. AUGA SZCCT0158]MBR1200018.1 hypothetical protein [Bradyrhizobium sp. AUGA SZCCT0158]
MVKTGNSIPTLVDLSVRIPKKREDETEEEVRVELRVHPAQLDGPNDLEFSVGLKRMTLSMDLSGVEPVPGSRYGEPTKDNVATHERTLSTEVSVESTDAGGGSVKLAINPELTLKADTSSVLKKKSNVSTTERKVHHRVRARGNLLWEITEPPWEDPTLDLTYMKDEPLCKIAPIDRANSKSVEVSAYAKQKDLIFDCKKSPIPFRTPNHKKLLNILLSKALSPDEPFVGVVTFSRSALSFED